MSSYFKLFILFCAMISLYSCDQKEVALASSDEDICNGNVRNGGLLASRISSFDSLLKLMQIEYYKEGKVSLPGDSLNDLVVVSYCMHGKVYESRLAKDISQTEIKKAKEGGLSKKLGLLFKSPFAVMNRNELAQIYVLARRRYDLFGISDVAFYDLAEIASKKIHDPSAYISRRDSGEKGYLNSFNHIAAQAFITTLYSEELADFIADVHERDNMPEIIHGKFTAKQLEEPNNNPMDNYVDLINNEVGQELGKRLKAKYKIEQDMKWDVVLLTAYLNDLQSFYQRIYQIKMEPFHEEEEVVRKFLKKINAVPNYKVNV